MVSVKELFFSHDLVCGFSARKTLTLHDENKDYNKKQQIPNEWDDAQINKSMNQWGLMHHQVRSREVNESVNAEN